MSYFCRSPKVLRHHQRHRDIIFEGAFILVSGKLSRRPGDDRAKVIADWLLALNELRSEEVVGVEVRLNTEKTDDALLERLQKTVRRHKGDNPVYLRVIEPNGDYLLRSRGLFAFPSDELLSELRAQLGEKEVSLGYHPRLNPGSKRPKSSPNSSAGGPNKRSV